MQLVFVFLVIITCVTVTYAMSANVSCFIAISSNVLIIIRIFLCVGRRVTLPKSLEGRLPLARAALGLENSQAIVALGALGSDVSGSASIDLVGGLPRSLTKLRWLALRRRERYPEIWPQLGRL